VTQTTLKIDQLLQRGVEKLQQELGGEGTATGQAGNGPGEAGVDGGPISIECG
jgi:hypothetical protein